MSYWNGKDFLRFISKYLFGNRGTLYHLTGKRLGVLLLALAVYLPAEFLIWSGLFLDELFFPAYHQVRIRQPVFIIGNPRSGTTFLQRALAKDRRNFRSMRTWEIFGAPSILSRKVLRGAVRFARSLGVRISQQIRGLEKLWVENDLIHRVKLRLPEEDEYLFIHIFSTLKIWSYAAMDDEVDPYIYFDELLPKTDKKRLMDFYQSCLQRYLFCQDGNDSHYLSKNPHFSPALETLLDRFPDGKFIYLLRNPLKAIPSHISLKETEWQLLGSPAEEYASKEYLIRAADHWYQDPLEKLKALPENQQVVVRFDDLVTDTQGTIEMIYQRLGFEITPEFLLLLDKAGESAREHNSGHRYSLEEMGIDPQALQDRFAEILQAYQLRK